VASAEAILRMSRRAGRNTKQKNLDAQVEAISHYHDEKIKQLFVKIKTDIIPNSMISKLIINAGCGASPF
jgi:hypothetical protein